MESNIDLERFMEKKWNMDAQILNPMQETGVIISFDSGNRAEITYKDDGLEEDEQYYEICYYRKSQWKPWETRAYELDDAVSVLKSLMEDFREQLDETEVRKFLEWEQDNYKEQEEISYE